jgi:hypothetical protein
MNAPSDSPRTMFPTADRKTVAVAPNSIGCVSVSEPRPKRGGGRRRAEVTERQEREFRELLAQGIAVNAARERSGITDGRALAILTEIFELWREAA